MRAEHRKRELYENWAARYECEFMIAEHFECETYDSREEHCGCECYESWALWMENMRAEHCKWELNESWALQMCNVWEQSFVNEIFFGAELSIANVNL